MLMAMLGGEMNVRVGVMFRAGFQSPLVASAFLGIQLVLEIRKPLFAAG